MANVKFLIARFLQFGCIYLQHTQQNAMKNYVKRIRESYRKELNVIEVNDLPLVLMTEVINQSILRGATKITVSFDGTIMMVHDNAVPLEDDDMLWRVTCRHEGMMSPERRRMFRILDRQWSSPPYATVNALCKKFKLIVSKGNRLHSIICNDGIVTSDNIGEVGIGDGNMVIMEPMIEASGTDTTMIGEMMELIQERFPQVTITFRTRV